MQVDAGRESVFDTGSFERGAQAFWSSAVACPSAQAASDVRRLLARVEPRLGWVPPKSAQPGVVTYAELEARGAAEKLVELAPRAIDAQVGRPRVPWPELSARVAAQTGVDASSARVRAGFTRGHLLEVVVGVPAGVGDLLSVAELLVEGLLGECFVDDWVAAIDAVPLQRGGALRVIQADSPASGMHPFSDLCAIAERAVSAVDAELPREPRALRAVGAEWTLLEMEPGEGGPQPERVLASTYEPELLKCALEGAPFHSRRFSRGGERFLWIGAPALGEGSARSARRQHVEEALDRALRARGLGAVIGSGFGERFDYLDLCLSAPESARTFTDPARDPALAFIAELAPQLGLSGATLAFYDTRWCEVQLTL